MHLRTAIARFLLWGGVATLLAGSAAAQVPLEEGYVPVGDGVELYYQKLGAGPPDLIVTNQVYTASALAGLANGRTVVFYDTRGRGRSTPISDPALLGMEQEIADLGRIQDHFGVDRTSVLGWSLWGGFVQLFAARHPDRVERIVAIGPAAPALRPYASMEPLRPGPDVEALERFDVSPFRIGMQMGDDTGWDEDEEVTPYVSPYEVCLQGKDILMPSQVVDASVLPSLNRKLCSIPNERNDTILFTLGVIFGSMGEYDWLDEFARIRAPVLIVHGDSDTIVEQAIADNRDAIADARVVVIEDAGHQGFSERPDRYVEVIDAFLREP